MSGKIISFATEPDGSPLVAPANTKRVTVKGWNPGQRGAPWYIYVNDSREAFSVATDASASALACLPSGNYKGICVDGAGKPVGMSFDFALRHLGGGPGSEQANETSAIGPELQKYIDRLEALNQKLLGVIDKLVDRTLTLANKILDTQIEVVKVMPKSVDASAEMIRASHSGGDLAQAAERIQDIWESAPNDGSQLSTVLNSPVVAGAAAALQKYMAKAAENGAEVMAGRQNNGHENMAERAARLAAAANDRARKAARS